MTNQHTEKISFILLKRFAHQEVCCLFHEKVTCDFTKIFDDVSVVVIVTIVRRCWSASMYSRFFTGPRSPRTYCSYVTSLPFWTRRRPSMNFQIEGWTTSSSLFRHPWAALACFFCSVNAAVLCAGTCSKSLAERVQGGVDSCYVQVDRYNCLPTSSGWA